MSYTIKLKTSAIQMGKTIVVNQAVNPTANNSSDFNLVSLNISTNLNLKYCNGIVGVLHTDASGNVTSKKIDTNELTNYSVTSIKLANSIFLSGIPTAPTADQGTNTTQIATTEFVQTLCSNILGFSAETLETLNSLSELANAIDNNPNFATNISTSIGTKVSLAANDVITGIKTFNTLPVLTPLNSIGIVHNNASGHLSTSLIRTADITNGAITYDKLDPSLVLPFNTTLDTSSINTNSSGIVTKGFLASSIKPFTDTLSNVQPVNPIIFYHVTLDNISYDNSENPVFTLSNNIRYIVDVVTKIFLPAITVEGIFYSVINKSADSIDISTASVEEFIYNSFVAPDGDDRFNLGSNQCLEFISVMSNGSKSWQAHYY